MYKIVDSVDASYRLLITPHFFIQYVVDNLLTYVTIWVSTKFIMSKRSLMLTLYKCFLSKFEAFTCCILAIVRIAELLIFLHLFVGRLQVLGTLIINLKAS